jgi:uncharacterized membrane protein YtjA (UPF0391 family)
VLNVILYLIALLTGMLAFSGLAGAGAMTIFQVSLILLVTSMLTRGFKRNVVWY